MGQVNLVSGNQPPQVHAGLNALVCVLSVSAANSAGDDLIIGKLPHGAVLTDVVYYPTAATANTILKFGTSASPSLFLASATYTSGAAAGHRLTATKWASIGTISVSDDAMPRYVNIVCKATTVLSVGNNGRLVVTYKMGSQAP